VSRFAGDHPTHIRHLSRDAELLIQLPRGVQILSIVASSGRFRARAKGRGNRWN